MGARIQLSYEELMHFMEEKHVEYERMPDDNVIIIDSYDGASFRKNNKGNSSILSYNTSMWHPLMSESKNPVTAASTGNILTFMQVICNEKPSTIFPVIKNVYKSKKKMREEGSPQKNKERVYV